MTRKHAIANGILWAAAIIASAILRAPATLSLVLLPSLATISVLMTGHGSRRAGCDA